MRLFCDVGDVLFYDFPVQLTYSWRLTVELGQLGYNPVLGPWEILDTGGHWTGALCCVPIEVWDQANHDAWEYVLANWSRLFVPIPGALDALALLSPAPCLVANQPREALEALRRYGVVKSVADAILNCEVGVSKPEPRLFEIACARAEVSPSEVVMVGDRLDNDIVPARRLGMRAAWVRPYAYDPCLAVEGVPGGWRDQYEQERRRRLRALGAAVSALPPAERPTWSVTSLGEFAARMQGRTEG